MTDISVIPAERIENAILLIRGQKVLLDSDLASLYGMHSITAPTIFGADRRLEGNPAKGRAFGNQGLSEASPCGGIRVRRIHNSKQNSIPPLWATRANVPEFEYLHVP